MKAPSCIRKAIHNERGMALIIVLLVLTVLSVLGMALLGLSLNNTKMSNYEQKYEAVYYIAEAGAADALIKVRKKEEDLKGTALQCDEEDETRRACFIRHLKNRIDAINRYELGFEGTYGKTIAEIEIERNPNEADGYIVTSTGTISSNSEENDPGKVERTVIQTFTVGKDEDDGSFSTATTALIVKSMLDIGGSVTINGNVWMEDKSKLSIKGNAKITGNVYSLSETNQLIPKFPKFPENSSLEEAEDYIVNQDKELLLSENISFFNDFQINDSILTINTGESDKKIVINNLKLGQKGQIRIKGNGKLTIYISGEFTMANKSIINDNINQEKLNIYWKGAGTLSLKNDHQEIYGLLYAENGTIDVNGGLIKGTVVSDKFIASGNATVEHGTEDNTLPKNGIINAEPIREATEEQVPN